MDAAYCELKSSYGHDAFLLEVEEQSRMIAGFLHSIRPDSAAPVPPIEDQISNRLDYALIAELVTAQSSVLDLGCGGGELLAWLRDHKGVKAQGVEIDPVKIQRAIASGVSAYQGDIEQGLTDYPDRTFDFVILSQTLQEMRYPLRVLREMLRVGHHAIVSFPNFGHWSTRFSHLVSGKAPRTKLFPYDWFESPNLHFLTIDDFVSLCRTQHWTIERQIFVSGDRKVHLFANLLAEVAVFSIRADS